MLELALDAVETIQGKNSLEKMLAHQLAAAHHASMAMTAQLNRCIENMDNPYNPDAQERANIQGTRLAGAIARTNATFQSGMLALQKMRSGGQQMVRVVHQHVRVVAVVHVLNASVRLRRRPLSALSSVASTRFSAFDLKRFGSIDTAKSMDATTKRTINVRTVTDEKYFIMRILLVEKPEPEPW